MYNFGRIEVHDDRDYQYGISPMLMSAPMISEKFWWDGGWWGNQGTNPYCVPFSWSHWLEDGPIIQDAIIDRPKPLLNIKQFYHACQKVDQWPGECVDVETECLTTNGWKRYNELSVDDEILTLNVDTELLEFKPLDNIFIFHNREYKIMGNNNMEFGVTEEHKWPTKTRNGNPNQKFQLLETNKLTNNNVIPLSCNYHFPPTPIYEDHFVELIGWILSEGYFRPATRRGNGVCVYQKKYKDELRRVLRENNIVTGYTNSNGLFSCEFSGVIADKVREICLDKNTSYDFLLSLTKAQTKLLVETLELGDGSLIKSEKKKNRRQFHQLVDNGNVLDIWQICNVLLGIPISRSNSKNYITNNGDIKKLETWSVRTGNIITWRKIKEKHTLTGTVWCPSTVNGTFIARRKGNIFITGNSYSGTSVRAGAKVLKDIGVIMEYRWAFSLDEIILTLLTLGPMVVGTKWYQKMQFPNNNGLIKPKGRALGGHAYLLNGIDINREYFRIKNSWGNSWGDNGSAYISFQDFERLFKDGGEACIAAEIKVNEVPSLDWVKPI